MHQNVRKLLNDIGNMRHMDVMEFARLVGVDRDKLFDAVNEVTNANPVEPRVRTMREVEPRNGPINVCYLYDIEDPSDPRAIKAETLRQAIGDLVRALPVDLVRKGYHAFDNGVVHSMTFHNCVIARMYGEPGALLKACGGGGKAVTFVYENGLDQFVSKADVKLLSYTHYVYPQVVKDAMDDVLGH